MAQGIFGIVDFSRAIRLPESRIKKIRTFLCGENYTKNNFFSFSCEHFILGMNRVVSSSPRHQCRTLNTVDLPAISLLHGEYYNHHELTKELEKEDLPVYNDLDLIVKLFRRFGPYFARSLNGLFSIAILDRQDNSLTLCNDRFGLAHQIYWTQIGKRLYFATHLKIILSFPEVEKEIDIEALNLFLKYSYIPSPKSIFRNIDKLPPGYLLKYKDGIVKLSPYWNFPSATNITKDPNSVASEYKRILKKTISTRLCQNGNTGILLSGGLDSSAIVALAADCTKSKIKTFSVGFSDNQFDESSYARIIARHFGTEHFEYKITGKEIEELPTLIWNIEEPYFECGLFLTYLGLKAAHQVVSNVIGGEGTDQLFGTGGFTGGAPAALHYLLLKSRLKGLSQKASRLLIGNIWYERDNMAFMLRILISRAIDLNNWYSYGYSDHELRQLHKDNDAVLAPQIFKQLNRWNGSFEDFYHYTLIRQDLVYYLNENIMVKCGRMADMMGLTIKEPYLDAGLVDFIISLDYRFKRSGSLCDHLIGKGKGKYLHRRVMEGVLPPEILNKPKQGGFVPVKIFLNDSALRKMIYKYLLHSKIIGNYFKVDYLKRLFDVFEACLKKPIFWPNFLNAKASHILCLLTFEIWYKYYIENDPINVNPAKLNEHIA